MKKLVGSGRDEHTMVMAASLDEVVCVIEDEQVNEIGAGPSDGCNAIHIDLATKQESETAEEGSQEEPLDLDQRRADDNTATDDGPETTAVIDAMASVDVAITAGDSGTTKNKKDVEVKKEEVEQQLAAGIRFMRFTPEEDSSLRGGITKYGVGHWAKILKDDAFKFHSSRHRDSLRMRAETLGITKKKKKAGKKSRTDSQS